MILEKPKTKKIGGRVNKIKGGENCLPKSKGSIKGPKRSSYLVYKLLIPV